MGTGQPSPQRKHTQPLDGPSLQGKARGCRTVLLRGSKPWLSSPGMH